MIKRIGTQASRIVRHLGHEKQQAIRPFSYMDVYGSEYKEWKPILNPTSAFNEQSLIESFTE